MAVRPDKKPRWATVPTVNPTTGKNNIIEPSEGKKDLGWDYLEKAARNTFNWVLNRAYQWIDYFDKNTQLLVIENDPVPDLSFKLQGGTYFTQGTTLVTIADATLGPVTAPAVNPRIDRVILNKSTGVVSITTGVEAASPVPIALLANEIALSQIALVVAQTQIFNADITDERPLWDTTLFASLTVAGISEASTDAEAIAKTDTDRHLTPSNLAALVPSETVTGLAEIATQAEVDAGADDLRYITPAKLAASTNTIPSGTLMLFQQTAAPTGWTKETTHDNKSLRVVTGAAGSGGTDSFTTVFGAGKISGAHALTIAQMPVHSVVLPFDVGGGAGSNATVQGINGDAATSNSNTVGSGNTHNHTLPIDVQYVDLIIAQKD